MQTVFTNSECAHIWSTQSQDHGTTSNGNLYFNNDTIYSYGSHFPIARFIDSDTVLFTTKHYSMTTNQHMSLVWQAIPRYIKIFYVPYIENINYYHIENIKYIASEVSEYIRKGTYSRQNCQSNYWQYAINEIDKLHEYAKYFKQIGNIKLNKGLSEVYNYDIEDLQRLADNMQAKIQRYESEKNCIQDEKNRQNIETEKQNIAIWKTGDTTYSYFPYSRYTYLRIKDNKIETSKGANIPIIGCRRIWQLIQSIINGDCTFNQIQSTDIYSKINKAFYPYHLHNIDSTGNITVGCHYIPYTELEDIARQLGYIS